jgi:hypothetical protein
MLGVLGAGQEHLLVPVVGAAGEDAVGVLETPIPGPPAAMPWAAQVPLARHHRAVAGISQQFGDRGGVAGQVALVARFAFGGGIDRVVEGAEADIDRVVAGEQRGAGGRAHWRSVEVAERHTLVGQGLEIGHGGIAASPGHIAKGGIVGDDQQHVWTLARVVGSSVLPRLRCAGQAERLQQGQKQGGLPLRESVVALDASHGRKEPEPFMHQLVLRAFAGRQ